MQPDGFSQRIVAFFHAPGIIIEKTKRFVTEIHRGNTKDLPRSKRAEILTGFLEHLKQSGPVYDETMNVVLWEAMNSTYGSDAVADIARAGVITREFVFLSTPRVGEGLELSEAETFETHLRWLEENGKRFGWKQ